MTADKMELDGVEMISPEVEPDIQPDALEQGNDVDASEASQSESGNLDVDGEVIFMGDSDVVVPPVVSVPTSAVRTFSLPSSPLQTTGATAFHSLIFTKQGNLKRMKMLLCRNLRRQKLLLHPSHQTPEKNGGYVSGYSSLGHSMSSSLVMNETKKIVWTETDHKLQVKSESEVDANLMVTAKRYANEKARIISKQMRRQEESSPGIRVELVEQMDTLQ
ncbi:hypothetical protein B0H14DRAFT_2602862 [Mycena olivaceomarginata]|nr:hypothetical protein B0H14DRAFT_2602862 [Mycena olivaceomarginata]